MSGAGAPSQLADLAREREALRRENAALRAEIEEQRAALVQLTPEIERLQNQVERNRAGWFEADALVARMRDELMRRRTDHECEMALVCEKCQRIDALLSDTGHGALAARRGLERVAETARHVVACDESERTAWLANLRDELAAVQAARAR